VSYGAAPGCNRTLGYIKEQTWYGRLNGYRTPCSIQHIQPAMCTREAFLRRYSDLGLLGGSAVDGRFPFRPPL